MMSSAHSEPGDDISDILGNSGPQKEESEADDDVERELARSISPPVTSPRTKSPSQSKSGKPKPKLSLFGTGAATTDEKPDNKDLGDSWGGSSAKSVKSDISDSESGLSPPLSPDGGLGYIPTMLDTKDQQQAGVKDDKENEKSEPKSANDSKAKRKTGIQSVAPNPNINSYIAIYSVLFGITNKLDLLVKVAPFKQEMCTNKTWCSLFSLISARPFKGVSRNDHYNDKISFVG